jgi:hypothetical protein
VRSISITAEDVYRICTASPEAFRVLADGKSVAHAA